MKQLLFAIAITISLIGCTNQKNLMSISSVNDVERVNFNSPKNVLIDVRTPEEYAEGHLPHAINIDVNGDDFEEKIKKLNPNKNYFVYCRSGKRSTLATETMNGLGFMKVANLKDGFISYKKRNKS